MGTRKYAQICYLTEIEEEALIQNLVCFFFHCYGVSCDIYVYFKMSCTEEYPLELGGIAFGVQVTR